MKFTVTRAFQQDQTVLFGIEIYVRSYLSQEWVKSRWFKISIRKMRSEHKLFSNNWMNFY